MASAFKEEEELARKNPDDPLARKDLTDLPQEAHEIVKLFEFKLTGGVIENEVFLFGSFLQKVQPYYGDIDSLVTVKMNYDKKKAGLLFVDMFRDKVNKLNNTKGLFVVDIKAGEYKDGVAIHWTVHEILDGKRGPKPDFNGHPSEDILLKDTIFNKNGLFKLDLIVPYYGKYLEATAVYFVRGIDGFVGADPELFAARDRVVKSLKENATKQLREGKYYKTFKRIFAQARIERNYTLLKKMIPLLQSQVALLSLIGGDIGTLKTLYEFKAPFDKKFVISELEQMKDKLSNITQVPIPFEEIKGLINTLEINLDKPKLAVDLINRLVEVIVTHVNTATVKFSEAFLHWGKKPPSKFINSDISPESIDFNQGEYYSPITTVKTNINPENKSFLT